MWGIRTKPAEQAVLSRFSPLHPFEALNEIQPFEVKYGFGRGNGKCRQISKLIFASRFIIGNAVRKLD